jgi:hypothetical protein
MAGSPLSSAFVRIARPQWKSLLCHTNAGYDQDEKPCADPAHPCKIEIHFSTVSVADINAATAIPVTAA